MTTTGMVVSSGPGWGRPGRMPATVGARRRGQALAAASSPTVTSLDATGLGEPCLPLLVEAEDLQLDGQVDLADRHAAGHREHRRGEVQDRRHAGEHEPVGDLLGHAARGGDHADGDAVLGDQLGQVVEVADLDVADGGADLGRLDVDQVHDREPPVVEAGVVGEGLPEVAGADDHHRPLPVEAELAAHLVHEVLDVVADPTGAVGAEVGQVLAHLGGVDAGQLGEAFGGHVRRAVGGDLVEQAEVDGKAGDRGVRDAATAALDHAQARLRPSCDRSQAASSRWRLGRLSAGRGAGSCRRVPRGSSSTNSTLPGHLYRARWSAHHPMTCSSVSPMPGSSTT